MASWNVNKFRSSSDVIDFLNGVIVGAANLHRYGADVDGLTFIFDKGGGNVTVTFAPVKNRQWTLDEIIAHINLTEASLAQKKVMTSIGTPDVRLRIDKQSLGSLTIKSTGTANSHLGFSTVADQVSVRIPNTEVHYIGPLDEAGNSDSWTVVRYS